VRGSRRNRTYVLINQSIAYWERVFNTSKAAKKGALLPLAAKEGAKGDLHTPPSFCHSSGVVCSAENLSARYVVFYFEEFEKWMIVFLDRCSVHLAVQRRRVRRLEQKEGDRAGIVAGAKADREKSSPQGPRCGVVPAWHAGWNKPGYNQI
jgi:hypothetical protein